MPKRIDYRTLAPEPLKPLLRLESYLRESGLERSLLHLVKLRASLINGCAYCVDMHTKDARANGETEQRLYAVSVWRETPFFSPREATALAYTEAVTQLAPHGVPEAQLTALRAHFSELEIVNLTFAVIAINAWNRLALSLGADVGSYVTGQHRERVSD
jgi:AhpD family alkylhydroperoxidase